MAKLVRQVQLFGSHEQLDLLVAAICIECTRLAALSRWCNAARCVPGHFLAAPLCTAPTAFVQPAGPLWAALCSHSSAFMVFSTGAHGCYCLLGGMTMIMMSGTVPLTCDMIRFEKCFQSVCSACRTGFWTLAAIVNGHGVFARLSLHALLPNASPFKVWWL